MTIQLQLIDGYFFPVDSVSREKLIDELRIERFPAHRFDVLSPTLVARGHKLAVYGYIPEIRQEEPVRGIKVGGTPKPQTNPCITCHLRFNCDSDECGRKNYRLFTNTKRL